MFSSFNHLIFHYYQAFSIRCEIRSFRIFYKSIMRISFSCQSCKITFAEPKGLGTPAVFLTTRLLVECYLRASTESSFNTTHNVCHLFSLRAIIQLIIPCQIHQVSLTPISGEFEHMAAYIGTVFKQDDYQCLLRQGSLIFSTRPDSANDNSSVAQSNSSSHKCLRLPLLHY
jgi:hypothetical protein